MAPDAVAHRLSRAAPAWEVRGRSGWLAGWHDGSPDGPARRTPGATTPLKGGEPQFVVDYAAYYKSPKRGFHPRAINLNGSWTLTTPLSFMNMLILTYIKEISPRPMLFIHGEKAHSRYFSETAYAAAAATEGVGDRPGRQLPDLYDQLDKIPFDRMADFFGKNLK